MSIGRRLGKALRDILDAEERAAKAAFRTEMIATLDDLRATISIPGPPRSLPYDPPRMETGVLQESYEVDVNTRGDRWTGEIATDVEYAKYLELGTRYMEPRPHLRPAMHRLEKREPRVLSTAISTAARTTAVAKGGRVR